MTSLALIVGINSYEDASVPNLSFCVNDATELAALLEEKEFGFETTVLLDEHATQRAIRLAAHELRKGQPERFLFFFAGHGEVVANRGYLIAHDGVEGDYGIEMSSLADLLANEHGLALSLLDCCHAGKAVPWRGVSPRSAPVLFRDARAATGQALVGACRTDELAAEDPLITHGKFTNLVLNGLLEGAVDANGEVTFLGLYEYACRGFTNDAAQQPVLRVQIDDRIVLGRGLSPGVTVEDSSHALRQAVVSAQARVEGLQRDFGVDTTRWRNGGWLEASKGLADLIDWKKGKERALPELVKSSEFLQTLTAVSAYQGRLAALQNGTSVHAGDVVEEIGRGAFGAVFRVETAVDDVAYKIYHTSELSDSAKVDRFRRGFKAMKRLSHPNIVEVFDLTEAPLGFTMSYVPGPNLRPILMELGPPSARLKIFKEIVQAVEYAHKMGVLHRDIKPENVLVGYEAGSIARVMLTDFDLAWFSTATTTTAEGGIGTIWYAAPEQLARPDAARSKLPAVDVYGLGQLMFFTITGRDPASTRIADNLSGLERALDRDFPSRSGAAELLELYRASTAYRQEERISDVSKFLDSLDGIILRHLETDDDTSLDGATFLEEIGRGLAGRAGSLAHLDARNVTVRSASGKVNCDISFVDKGRNQANVTMGYSPSGKILVAGSSSFADARLTINKRLDGKIQQLNVLDEIRIVRRSGSSAVFESFIEIEGLSRTRRGAAICSEIGNSLSSVLDQYFS